MFTKVKCPVCGKETLDNYWICSNCKWEHDGSVVAEDDYSSANGMTLGDAIKNYRSKL